MSSRKKNSSDPVSSILPSPVASLKSNWYPLMCSAPTLNILKTYSTALIYTLSVSVLALGQIFILLSPAILHHCVICRFLMTSYKIAKSSPLSPIYCVSH